MGKPIHPGVILQKTLDHRAMTQKDLAVRLGITEKQVNLIVKEKAPITPYTATRLEFALNVPASFWNNLQKEYEQRVERDKFEKQIENEKSLLRQFTCYKVLAGRGYVKETRDTNEKLTSLLEFFGVTSLSLIRQSRQVDFRMSNRENYNFYNILSWLRIGDVDARKIETDFFNHAKLYSYLGKFRELSSLSPNDYSEKLRALCAECGVVLLYTPYLENTHISGASRWLSPNRALIQLSTRLKTNDGLWFSFFHELAHILKHSKKEEFIDFDNTDNPNDKETEADLFASEKLIPSAPYNQFVHKADFTKSSIIEFAKELGVGKDIVAGRLAHDKHITWQDKHNLTTHIQLVK